MSGTVLHLEDGSWLELDGKGYLLDPARWTPRVAECMASQDGVRLTPDHWVILHIFRDYFRRFDMEPPMRVLVKLAAEKFGTEKGNSRFLYQLFADGPVTQACRYAGLPRPVSCI